MEVFAEHPSQSLSPNVNASQRERLTSLPGRRILASVMVTSRFGRSASQTIRALKAYRNPYMDLGASSSAA